MDDDAAIEASQASKDDDEDTASLGGTPRSARQTKIRKREAAARTRSSEENRFLRWLQSIKERPQLPSPWEVVTREALVVLGEIDVVGLLLIGVISLGIQQ